MNILAHLFLSGSNNDILVGNFIADHVKGNQILNYPIEIQKGIRIHRQIDTYTDKHALFRKSKDLFRKVYHKYSGVVTDIVYDHFLTRHWDDFSYKSFPGFVSEKHKILKEYYDVFPGEVQAFFPYFIKNNWLLKYSSVEGIYSVLRGMGERTSMPKKPGLAIEILLEKYSLLNDNFQSYFPEIISYVDTLKKQL